MTGILTALLGLSGPVSTSQTVFTGLASQTLAIITSNGVGPGGATATSQERRRSRRTSDDETDQAVDEEKPPSDDQPAPEDEPETSQPKEQSVKGRVRNRDGKDLSGLKVSVTGPRSDTVWTGPNGAFHFTAPPGDYVLTIESGETTREFPAKVGKDKVDLGVLTIDE